MFAAASRVLSIYAALMVWSVPAMAAACYEAPEEATTFRAAVDAAETIVLAKITYGQTPLFARKNTVDFDFEVVESLKGEMKPGDTFKKRGLWVKQDGAKDRGNLEAHWDPAFWDRQITRLDSVYDCGQKHAFDPNRTYLIFDPKNDANPSPLSVTAEAIDRDNDRWINAVRQLIEDPALEHARSKTGVDYLLGQKSVALVAVEGCSEKLRPNAFHVAEITTLSGDPISRDQLDPATFSDALQSCDGFTVVLGVFYRTDRETGLPINVTRKPMQQFVPVQDGEISFADFTSEIAINGPDVMSLDDLVVGLLPTADMEAVDD